MTAARYLQFSLGIAVLALVASAAINIGVDPLGCFGSPIHAGFNAIKPMRQDREREAQLCRIAADANPVFLGTSRTAFGMDPRPAGINLAFGGQSLHETRLILEHLAPRLAGRKVIVGLDLFSANAWFGSDIAATRRMLERPAWRIALESALSLDTLDLAVATVRRQDPARLAREGREVRPDGFHVYTDAHVAERGGARAMFEQSERVYARDFYFPPPLRRFAWQRPGGPDAAADLEALFAAAHRHGVKLQAYVSPSHARQWEVLDAVGLWPQFERWKEMLAQANASAAAEAGRPAFPLRDFAGHFGETSEALPPAGDRTTMMRDYWDSSHYRDALGNIVVKRLDESAADAGESGAALDPATLAAHLGALREKRDRWRAANPAEAAAVRAAALAVAPRNRHVVP